MMRKLTILCLLLTAVTFSCSKVELEDVAGMDCATIGCTFEFRWVDLTVVDAVGNPLALDRAKVTRLHDGRDVTPDYNDAEWDNARGIGHYRLASSITMKDMPIHKRIKLRFQGFVGNRQVVNADYEVTVGCCRDVSVLVGELALTVK